MKINFVHLDIKPECVERFAAVCIANHDGSRLEPGNIRFDVLQNKDDPTKFTLCEVFTSDEAIAFHKTTAHYKAWAEAAAECSASPRSKTGYKALAFN
jgi:autoinducer 2-degrading protein